MVTGGRFSSASHRSAASARRSGGDIFWQHGSCYTRATFAKIPYAGDPNDDAALLAVAERSPPDASWISQERFDALGDAEKASAFWRVCPDVIVEIMSEYDSWPDLVRKVKSFIANGAEYAVAIDCHRRYALELGRAPADLQLDFDAIYDA